MKNPSAVPSTANFDDKRDSMIDAQNLDIRSRYNIEINDDLNEELRKEESGGYLNFNLSLAEDEDDDYDKRFNVGEYEYHADHYDEESKVDLIKSDSYEILSRI